MRRSFILALLAASLAALQGSTLQQLSLDDMIRQSTLIVRGQAQVSYSELRGSMIYTHYTVTVAKVYKGTAGTRVDVAVPGGLSGGMRQAFAGAPNISSGQSYVMFLWTSKTGLTQIIGLSQGLFLLTKDSSGRTAVLRAAATETMLNAAGQPVADADFELTLGELTTEIQNVLRGAGQ